MEIQCECGKFRAELTQFPKNTPGRLICYCDDCQSYMRYLKRADLLDQNGGTEIIPVYPADINVIMGQELMTGVRLGPKGMFRFSTTCCNTPIANTDATRPWVGIHSRMHTTKNPKQLDQALGTRKIGVMGKFAKGTPPAGTPQKLDLKAMLAVLPFILKGVIFKKAKRSPFFANGQAIVPVKVLTLDERRAALNASPDSKLR